MFCIWAVYEYRLRMQCSGQTECNAEHLSLEPAGRGNHRQLAAAEEGPALVAVGPGRYPLGR